MSRPANIHSLKEYLSTLQYFQKVDEVVTGALAQESIYREFVPGAMIFFEGDPASGLWVIESGSVKIFKLSPHGEEHILHLLGAGNTFNDIAALDGGANPANAAALSQVTAWVLPSSALERAMLENSQIALNVTRALAGRVRRLVQQIEDLALYSVPVRLARFLLKQSEDPALGGPGITRTAIAAHINTTPQTISNTLRALEEIGAIKFDRHRIFIIREDLLRSIAMI